MKSRHLNSDFLVPQEKVTKFVFSKSKLGFITLIFLRSKNSFSNLDFRTLFGEF